MKRREFIAGLGGVAAWPLGARAQQRPLPVIGYLTENASVAAFRQGIGEQGYVEGRNVEVLYRFAEYEFERLPGLAADLVRRRVAVIFCNSTPASQAAKKATAAIPIVFSVGTDPVQAGLVASLNRPGGNVTGVTYLLTELVAKRLELLHELAPAAKSIGYLYNSNYFPTVEEPSIKAVETAAGTLGLRLVTAKVTTASEIEGAFAMLVSEGNGALLIGASLFLWREQIIALATHYALPAMYAYRAIAEAGGLISYGGRGTDADRLAGTYVGRILKGEKPADLPVQQSTKVELIINMRTARALGIMFPTSLLVRADEVIE